MEASYSLDAARRSGADPDELEEEQRERQYRNRMNLEFQAFVKRVEEGSGEVGLEFDTPYRELGFYGVPPHNKSTCYIMPAVNAIVELTEPPWFCVPLVDIEVAHFERVVYGLKNFDLVLVLKDYTVKPVMVSAINVEHLDSLKGWLDSCNIKFYEGNCNLNWGNIMKTIQGMGLEEFYDDGGWKNVLAMDDDDEEGEEESDDESEFEPSDEDSEEEESDDDDDEYEDSEDEDSGEESLDSDESEGKDFDELEEEAKREDKKRGRYEEDEKPKTKGKKKSQDYSESESESEDSEDARRKAKAKKAKLAAAPPPKAGAKPSSSSSAKPGSSSSAKPGSSSAKPGSSSAKPGSSSSAKPGSFGAKPGFKK
jgi:nucleosome binding factor SPN SPT16 subunit